MRHLIERFRWRAAVRRWRGHPTTRAVARRRVAARVEGLGEQLLVVDARTHRAVTDRFFDCSRSVTAPQAAADLGCTPDRPRPAASTISRSIA